MRNIFRFSFVNSFLLEKRFLSLQPLWDRRLVETGCLGAKKGVLRGVNRGLDKDLDRLYYVSQNSIKKADWCSSKNLQKYFKKVLSE